MRFPPVLLFAAALVCTSAAAPRARAEDAAKIDPAARVEQFSPGPDTTKSTENLTFKRDDRVQSSRATLAGLIEEPTAPLAEKRAPITLAETREKEFITHKDASISTANVLPRKVSPLAGQTARDSFQTKTNIFTSTGRVAEKYQQGIRAANAASVQLQPDLNRQSSFDQLNRFVFKRNGPGTDGGAPLVTAAGGGLASTLPTASGGAASAKAPTRASTAAVAGDAVTDDISSFSGMDIVFPANKPPTAKAIEAWKKQPGGGGLPAAPLFPTK